MGEKNLKRYGNLWDKVCDIDNLKAAHKDARRGKKHYYEVKWVNANEEKAIKDLQNLLISGDFTTSQYTIEDRFDGRKLRTLYKLPYYPDRIVQHALMRIVGPIFESCFIRDTFQSISNRGTHDARKRVEKAIKNKPPQYALKFDIKKYYPNVQSDLLKIIIREKIKCKPTLKLIDDIVNSCEGIPIGNYTSQYFGNLYLCKFDWWVKQELRPNHYFRYCDDLVILTDSAKEAHSIREKMFARLSCTYKLEVKSDWQVFPVDTRGLDFVGFVFTTKKTRLRKKIAKGLKNKAKQIRSKDLHMCPYKIVNGAGSYWGWCKHSDSKGLFFKYITPNIQRKITANKSKIKERRYEG